MITENISLNFKERFSAPHSINRDKLLRAAEAAADKLAMRARRDGIGFPGTCSVNYKYNLGTNYHWECGMYTGCFWLAYELTGDKFFRQVAEEHLDSYRQRIEKKINLDDHDVGFVYIPSCIAAYNLTGNEQARKWALDAAKYLYEHSYSKEGKFIIRLHELWDSGEGCRTMMDSLMNAPLFFWAAGETGNEEYYQAAFDHTITTANYLIRNDGSSFHHYQFDPKTAMPVRGLTFQGHADNSCWSRGHSWGVYGFPVAYRYSACDSLREVHRGVSYFMLNHLPNDFIPYWDYDFTSGNEQPRDSSAAVISACGLNEMTRMLDDCDEKRIFEGAASRMLEAVIDQCTGDIGIDYDGLICHVTHALPQGEGIDECAPYGDYFYLEALKRYINPEKKCYW